MEYFRLLVSAVVSEIVNFLGYLGRRKHPKLLVVKLDHLGDVVTATPVFRSLREAFPDARIDALVGSWAKDLVAASPFVDKVLTYDSARFRRPAGAPEGPGRRLRQMRAIAAHRYTHIVDLRGDSWTLLLPFLSGAVRRVDRGSVRLESWVEQRVSGGDPTAARIPRHEVETNLEIIRPLLKGVPDAGASWTGTPWTGVPVAGAPKVEVFINDHDRRALAERLRPLGIPVDAPLVVIHPGASWRPRAWRLERFAEVARQILDRHPVHVVIVGTVEEMDIADKMGLLLRDPRAHIIFDLRLSETATLIERSLLFIGNDSGIAHLAAAIGTPLIALYGPQDPRRFRPWSEKAVVFHKPVPCFPCKQKVCVIPHNPCVNLTYVEEVMRSAETLLGPSVGTPSIS